MALDPTLSESCFKNSIKKFFVDTIQTGEDISIDFDVQYVIPEDTGVDLKQWVSVKFGNIIGGTVSRSHIIVYLFTRGDSEGVDLSLMRDTILDKLIDLNMTDGKARIPFYDLSWSVIGAMLPTVQSESDDVGILKDTTKYKWVRVDLAWGSK